MNDFATNTRPQAVRRRPNNQINERTSVPHVLIRPKETPDRVRGGGHFYIEACHRVSLFFAVIITTVACATFANVVRENGLRPLENRAELAYRESDT